MLKLKPEEDIVLCQSADPVNYFAMLRSTAKPTQAFCARQNIRYLCLHGVLRGYHPWHACYNRIIIMHELLQTGFTGWYLHLDADAFVHDPDYDIRGYLAESAGHSFVFTHGGTRELWDVNDGVYFANFAHPHTRQVVEQWMAQLEAIQPERLLKAEKWYQTPCDQQMLHRILRSDPALQASIRHEHPRFINGPTSTFIRQLLRAFERDPEQRLAKIELQVEQTMAKRKLKSGHAVALVCGLNRALGLPLPTKPEEVKAALADRAALITYLEQAAAEARRRHKLPKPEAAE